MFFPKYMKNCLTSCGSAHPLPADFNAVFIVYQTVSMFHTTVSFPVLCMDLWVSYAPNNRVSLTFIYRVCVCLFVCGSMVYMWKSEKNCGSCLSPSTMWVPRIKLISLGFVAVVFYSLRHLSGPNTIVLMPRALWYAILLSDWRSLPMFLFFGTNFLGNFWIFCVSYRTGASVSTVDSIGPQLWVSS